MGQSKTILFRFPMDCLKFHEFFNNLMGLPVIIENGLMSNRRKYFHRHYQRFTEVIVFRPRNWAAFGLTTTARAAQKPQAETTSDGRRPATVTTAHKAHSSMVPPKTTSRFMSSPTTPPFHETKINEAILLQFLGVIGQFLAVPSVWIDMNVLCGCLASGTHTVQVLLKTIYLNYYREDFIEYLTRISAVQKYSESFDVKYLHGDGTYLNYYSRQSRYVKLMLITHFTITIFSTSAYFLPFVYDSIVHYYNVEHQLTPIVVYLPVYYNWTPLFQTVVILLTVCFYLNNLKTVVIDNFMLGLIVLSMSHFRYQKELLKGSISKYMGKEQRDGGEETAGADERSVMREWIIAHQKLLEATCHFGKVISPYLFLEFIYIMIHTCVPAFVITSTFSWTVAQKMAVFFIVGGGILQLLLMSVAGDAFTQSWETIASDLFQPEIFRGERKWMFHFFIMVRTRLKTPFRLSAFKLFPLSCATFATISRLIVSHYMTLNQIQTLKNGKA